VIIESGAEQVEGAVRPEEATLFPVAKMESNGMQEKQLMRNKLQDAKNTVNYRPCFIRMNRIRNLLIKAKTITFTDNNSHQLSMILVESINRPLSLSLSPFLSLSFRTECM
jgi:hypothetical protein